MRTFFLSIKSVVFPSVKMSMTRSVSLVDGVIKKKKVKMHKCPECQKEFPGYEAQPNPLYVHKNHHNDRPPSGLRTHMNMHTKEKRQSTSPSQTTLRDTHTPCHSLRMHPPRLQTLLLRRLQRQTPHAHTRRRRADRGPPLSFVVVVLVLVVGGAAGVECGAVCGRV